MLDAERGGSAQRSKAFTAPFGRHILIVVLSLLWLSTPRERAPRRAGLPESADGPAGGARQRAAHVL